MRAQTHHRTAEYGDFQTPPRLAAQVCRLLNESDVRPASIVEPTCGVGNLLFAAVSEFPAAQRAIGVDINPDHISAARQRADDGSFAVDLVEGDFFSTQWQRLLRECADPILVVGNPPWVTNTHLSKLDSSNTPEKSNDVGLSGYDAISGKSNFDISEWMLVRLLDWLNGRHATLAMLCKTSVARKVLAHAWRSGIALESASIHLIDARESFGASVEACLLVCVLSPAGRCDTCGVFPNLSCRESATSIGYRDGYLLANVDAYQRWKTLLGPERYRWRSGIKHDCSAVMELVRTSTGYLNGLGEKVELEDDYLFPLLKSSDIANNRVSDPKRYALVTQRKVGDDTRVIQHLAPKTWRYLESHEPRLANRRSAIYAKQPQFSVFGVGDYSFAPWKVAISGLYKGAEFRVVPPFDGKPCVLDDTCYFLACDSEEEARCIEGLLRSDAAVEFYSAFLFADSKRPVTVDLLRRLDLLALARLLGSEQGFRKFLDRRARAGKYAPETGHLQHVLFS
jgi:hypothetical protein